MATRRYSINPEDKMQDVTEAAGAAVVTKNIELTVDFGTLAGLTPTMTGTQAKMQVLLALEKLHAYIETKGLWPPA
jgi:hypothetical protein